MTHIEGQAELKGSVKQVDWAETIRGQKFGEMESEMQSISDLEFRRQMDDAFGRIIACNSAKWWIDNREMGGGEMLEKAIR